MEFRNISGEFEVRIFTDALAYRPGCSFWSVFVFEVPRQNPFTIPLRSKYDTHLIGIHREQVIIRNSYDSCVKNGFRIMPVSWVNIEHI